MIRQDITLDQLVRFQNRLDILFDKEIERVEMLFDETFDFEKGGQEFPFVLRPSVSKMYLSLATAQ